MKKKESLELLMELGRIAATLWLIETVTGAITVAKGLLESSPSLFLGGLFILGGVTAIAGDLKINSKITQLGKFGIGAVAVGQLVATLGG